MHERRYNDYLERLLHIGGIYTLILINLFMGAHVFMKLKKRKERRNIKNKRQ